MSDIGKRAHRIYDEKIRDKVEPQLIGKFLVIDVSNGDYEIDSDELAAFDRLIAKHPEGQRFLMRIGYRTAHKIGGSYLKSYV